MKIATFNINDVNKRLSNLLARLAEAEPVSYGADVRWSRGDYVYKEREIDRDADRYRELVREETGEVIHEVEEPLSEHWGHGSAKFKIAEPPKTDDS